MYFPREFDIEEILDNNSQDDYDKIVWADDSTKPSHEEFAAKMAEIQQAAAYRILREKRNKKLEESDIKVLPDFPHASQAKKDA